MPLPPFLASVTKAELASGIAKQAFFTTRVLTQLDGKDCLALTRATPFRSSASGNSLAFQAESSRNAEVLTVSEDSPVRVATTIQAFNQDA